MFTRILTWKRAIQLYLSCFGTLSYLASMFKMSHQPKKDLVHKFEQINSIGQNLIIIAGLIKSCAWKGEKLNCSSIFSMYPTDRGMCCTFNKQKADDMFKKSRFQKQLNRLSVQDKDLSFEDSATPPWLVTSLCFHL